MKRLLKEVIDSSSDRHYLVLAFEKSPSIITCIIQLTVLKCATLAYSNYKSVMEFEVYMAKQI